MCGIIGVVGEIDFELTKVFTKMLQVDVVRGKDSTGIACVDKDGNVSYAKEAWLPTDFLQHRTAEAVLKTAGKRVLIGHNRHATVGAVDKAGAHPFEFDNVIGVHNGTTPKYNFKEHHKFSVDSEALYYHMNEEGIEDMWKNMAGAASLAFYNKVTKRFHLLRNKERPMYVAFTKNSKAMLFASEPWMIEAGVYNTKVELDKEKGIRSTTTDQLYSFDPFKAGCLPKFSTRKVEAHVPYTATRKWEKPVLNTWAKSLYDIRVGHEIKFEIVSYTLHPTSGVYTFALESTSTKAVLSGRLYFTKGRDDEKIADALKSIDTADTWRGEIASYNTCGTMMGYTIRAYNCYNEDALVRDYGNGEDDVPAEGLIIDDIDGVITREMFEKQDKVSNCCNFCGDPLNFDDPVSFKYIGKEADKSTFICSTCDEDFRQMSVSYCTETKHVRSISDYTS